MTDSIISERLISNPPTRNTFSIHGSKKPSSTTSIVIHVIQMYYNDILLSFPVLYSMNLGFSLMVHFPLSIIKASFIRCCTSPVFMSRLDRTSPDESPDPARNTTEQVSEH